MTKQETSDPIINNTPENGSEEKKQKEKEPEEGKIVGYNENERSIIQEIGKRYDFLQEKIKNTSLEEKREEIFSEISELEEELKGRLELREIIEKILTSEQLNFFENTKKAGKIILDPEGKIISPFYEEGLEEEIKTWKAKEGVIDVALGPEGILVVVYNADIKIPEGCNDLRIKDRAGEYDPEENICFINISSTYDFLNECYHADWVQGIVGHEIRHGLVRNWDMRISEQGEKSNYRNENEQLSSEEYKQLTYLDELHSQYFDVLEGNIEGKSSFKEINSKFYSIAESGSHLEVASNIEKNKEVATEIFHFLQGFILSKRMAEKEPDMALSKIIEELSASAGAILATEKSLFKVKNKIDKLWSELKERKGYREKISQFLEEYQPESFRNTPILEKIPEKVFK